MHFKAVQAWAQSGQYHWWVGEWHGYLGPVWFGMLVVARASGRVMTEWYQSCSCVVPVDVGQSSN